MKNKLILVAIIFLAFLLRVYGLNWDQNQHLHPDERFLTMVAGAIKWPISISEYFDTSTSLLNPHNVGFDFYVYGTYPVIFVKLVAETLHKGDYNGLVIVGRFMSAVVDMCTLILVYFLAKRLSPLLSSPLFASFVYGISVLPIQLSHFFAVDPYLVLFLTLSFYVLTFVYEKASLVPYATLGVTFGLAISAKVSAIYFLPIITLVFLAQFFRTRQIVKMVISCLVFLLFLYGTIRISLPYAFAESNVFSITLNPKVVSNIKQLESYNNPQVWFPPGTQWHTAIDYIYPLENLLVWGLGLPLGLITLISLIYLGWKYYRKPAFLLMLWSVGFFLYQGGEYVKTLRYFYVIYPFLAISVSIFVSDVLNKNKYRQILYLLIVLTIIMWPMSFMTIYTRPHSRVTATNWIYENIPHSSVLSCEYWDDCLPLGGLGPYKAFEYHLYDPDTLAKWQNVQSLLNKTDYLVLSSNRLYASMMSDPTQYPITSEFYTSLFNGELGFTQVMQISSRPFLPLPGISKCIVPFSFSYPTGLYGGIASPPTDCPPNGITIVDDYADESFTVYDHPKVTIFKKHKSVNFLSLLNAQQLLFLK